jgi:hypothetical protein
MVSMFISESRIQSSDVPTMATLTSSSVMGGMPWRGRRHRVNINNIDIAFSEVRSREKPCDNIIVQLETHDKVIARFFHYNVIC